MINRKLKTVSQKKNSKVKYRSPSDNLCKFLAEKYPEQIVRWLCGLRVKNVEVLKTELGREPIRADTAILFGNYLLHAEFQTTVKSNPPIALRMLDYYVSFKRKFAEKSIRQFLIVLKDTGDDVPDKYEDEFVTARYNVVKMWEQDANKLMAHIDLIPLAVLCNAKNSDEKLLKAVARKLKGIKNRAERQVLTNITQVFAGLRYSSEMIYQILRGGDMLEESVIVQDWIQRGIRQGLEQGLEQGLKHEREFVLRLLALRVGKLSAKTRKQIETLSRKQLEKLGEALLNFNDKSDLAVWLEKHVR